MALTKCNECGHEISKTARVCPSCGAKVNRTRFFTKLVLGLIVLGVIGSILSSIEEKRRVIEETAQATREQARLAALTPEEKAAEEKQRVAEAVTKKEAELRQLGLRWSYEESSDQMGRGKIKTANINSVNKVNFGFPYQGAQRGWLLLRQHPKHGKDVIFGIDRGQFLCRIDACSVNVRFDNGKAQSYSAGEPADHSTTVLFIRNYDRFLANARKAKTVYIEAQFFQEGTRVFEFAIEGLKW